MSSTLVVDLLQACATQRVSNKTSSLRTVIHESKTEDRRISGLNTMENQPEGLINQKAFSITSPMTWTWKKALSQAALSQAPLALEEPWFQS